MTLPTIPKAACLSASLALFALSACAAVPDVGPMPSVVAPQVLTAQDRALQAQRVVADLLARTFTLDVALIRALGGGFVAPRANASAPIDKDTIHGSRRSH